MMRESAHTIAEAPAAAVFAQVTDISRLPEWNRAIPEVTEQPPSLAVGAVWKVRIHTMGTTWISKSTLVELDETNGRFRYRTEPDDGNPSYADWEWRVTPLPTGSEVSVTVDIHPQTFWRKYLLVQIRRPVLRKEMQTSVEALAGSVRV
ncbi:MAG TPA: SRPBCC family protein [Acidimicrobiia bacterium]|jgi:hypothetical protein